MSDSEGEITHYDKHYKAALTVNDIIDVFTKMRRRVLELEKELPDLVTKEMHLTQEAARLRAAWHFDRTTDKEISANRAEHGEVDGQIRGHVFFLDETYEANRKLQASLWWNMLTPVQKENWRKVQLVIDVLTDKYQRVV